MAVTATTLKNTLTHTIVKVVGSGTHTISLSSLIDTATKETFFESGKTVIQLRDTIGIVVGGYVTGTGIPAGTTVTEIHDNRVTISAATVAPSSGVYVFASQVATDPVVNIYKVFYDTDATGGIKIARNSVNVLAFNRSGVWQFDGFALTDNNTFNIVVTLGGTIDSTVILELRKISGYGDSQHPFKT